MFIQLISGFMLKPTDQMTQRTPVRKKGRHELQKEHLSKRELGRASSHIGACARDDSKEPGTSRG